MGQLTDAGFVIRRLDEIIAAMDAGMKAIYGADINTDQDSPDGQMIGIYSQALGDLEELSGEMWRQMDPDHATGPNLDRIVAFAGVRRNRDSPSYLRSVILSGIPRMFVPADSVVVDHSGEQWHSLARVQLSAYGSARVDFQSVDPGSFAVAAHEELTIMSGVTGWHSAVTSSASVLGVNEETDPVLRARFYLSRERTAQDDRSAMRANLLALNGVVDAQVYENYRDEIDANGVAPHSINAVVDGGLDVDIGFVILSLKPAGTGMQGETSVLAVDSFGHQQLIVFDRPTRRDVYVSMQVRRRAAFTDIDTDSIAQALASTIFHIAEPVIITELYAIMYTVPGFITTDLRIGLAPDTLADADIAVGPRDKAVIDAANVDITVI